MRNIFSLMTLRSSLASVLLVSLAVAPAAVGAGRDEQKTDRTWDKQQVQARPNARGAQAPTQTPSRATDSKRPPNNAPLPAAASAKAAAAVGSRVREAPGRAQDPAPRPAAFPNSRQPEPRHAAPQATVYDRRVRVPEQVKAQPARPVRVDPVAAPPEHRPITVRPAQERKPIAVRPVPEHKSITVRPVQERRPVSVQPWQERENAPVVRPAPVKRPEAPPSPVINRAPANNAVRSERRLSIPEANFRGPGSEARARVVAPDASKRAPARFQNWVREQNRSGDRRDGRRPEVDRIGNRVPSDAFWLDRNTTSHLRINYNRITNHFGSPGFSYVLAPGAAWGNGFFPRGHRHHSVVVISLFYPFYYSDPQFVGFHYSGYYPSVYTYFGWAPGWVYPERVHYAPTDYVYASAYGSDYRLDSRGASQALSELRSAWLDGDAEALAAHLTDQVDIRVYFDGEYSYTTTTDDFYAMTLDTMATTRTVAMDFDRPIWISSNEVFYTGSQVFSDPDGEEHTVYVSFRFRKLGTEWYLVALGTAKHPIEHQYTDFRYDRN